MIHEIALWFRERGYSISRNELAFNVLFGFIIMAVASLFFVFTSTELDFLLYGPVGPITVSTFGGIAIGTLFAGVIHDAFYNRARWMPLPFAAGIIIGLATAAGFFGMLPMMLVLVIPIIVLAEVFFLKFDTLEPSPGENVFWFTVQRKLKTMVEAFVAVLAVIGLFKGSCEIFKWGQANWEFVKQFFGVVGIVAVIILGIYFYIRLNALKYRWTENREEEEVEEETTPRRRKRKTKRRETHAKGKGNN